MAVQERAGDLVDIPPPDPRHYHARKQDRAPSGRHPAARPKALPLRAHALDGPGYLVEGGSYSMSTMTKRSLPIGSSTMTSSSRWRPSRARASGESMLI